MDRAAVTPGARAAHRAGLAVLLPALLAAQALGETLEGQHLVILGAGMISPGGLDINATPGGDFDGDGIADGVNSMRQFARASAAGSLQYYYHVTPRLGLGVNILGTSMKGESSSTFFSKLSLSGGPTAASRDDGTNFVVASVKAWSIQFLPVARYAMRPLHKANPYVLCGAGFNYFSATAEAFSNMLYPAPSNKLNSVRRSHRYSRTSLGLAATAGAGMQYSIGDQVLLGAEGRWTYSQIDKDAFGDDAWQSLGGYLWLGWKWTAPL